MMKEYNRRDFLRSAAAFSSALFLNRTASSRAHESILLFTKSSGYEHAVIKNSDGKPSVVEQSLRGLGARHGFDVLATKDGRIFDSNEFRAHSAMFFYTTGDLTKSGTDGTPPMSLRGNRRCSRRSSPEWVLLVCMRPAIPSIPRAMHRQPLMILGRQTEKRVGRANHICGCLAESS